MNLPNILSLVRILVIPVLMLIFYLPIPHNHLIAVIIFIFACVTDWLDGYFARSLKQSTRLGAFLDPVADKLMVSIALVITVGEPQFQFVSFHARMVIIPIAFITIPVAIIVGREILVSALREWMAEMGKRASVAVSRLGKVKTTTQMIALAIMLYCEPTTSGYIIVIGYLFLYIAAILTIWSMLFYLKAAWPEFKSK